MYSVYGDTVLDPFWGTGTTSFAAMVAGRNSIGYELQDQFTEIFDERVSEAPITSREVIQQRLDDHRTFVEDKLESDGDFSYESEQYDFPITTKQEKSLQFYSVTDTEKTKEGYRALHEPVEGDDLELNATDTSGGAKTSLTDF
jgi:hypothetical protein